MVDDPLVWTAITAAVAGGYRHLNKQIADLTRRVGSLETDLTTERAGRAAAEKVVIKLRAAVNFYRDKLGLPVLDDEDDAPAAKPRSASTKREAAS